MPEHGLDIMALVLLLAEETRAASISNRLELRQDDDGIDTPDDDDDVVAAPTAAPTTTDPATATTSAASTEAASSAGQLDKGSKAGIAIGVVVGIIFIGGAVFMYWRHRRQRTWQRRNKYNNNNGNGHDRNRPPNMTMTAHNVPPKSASDSSPPLGSVSPPSTNPDAGRAWFDNGPGSSELPSREAGQGDGVAGWVYDKAELSAPEAGGPRAPGQLHPHHQFHYYPDSTELPTAGNQIHEIPETSACSYAPVELPAAVPDHARYSGFTGFSGGEGEDIGRNVSTRTSNTDGSGRRESAAPTFTVSSPATTVADTVSDSGYGHYVGQVSPASPYARSAAGGNTV